MTIYFKINSYRNDVREISEWTNQYCDVDDIEPNMAICSNNLTYNGLFGYHVLIDLPNELMTLFMLTFNLQKCGCVVNYDTLLSAEVKKCKRVMLDIDLVI